MNAVIEQQLPMSPLTLPILAIEVSGSVVTSNLDDYRTAALELVSSINTDLQTDADFDNAEKAVKWCGDIEEKLGTAKTRAIKSMADVDVLLNTIDVIREEFRQKRLQLEKLGKARREARRLEVMEAGSTAFRDHVEAMNATLRPRATVPVVMPNFAEACKGRRTIAGVQAAVNAELHSATNKVTETANLMRKNLSAFDALNSVEDVSQLFRDLQSLLTKDAESFLSIVRQRIADEVARRERIKTEAAEAERKRQEHEAERQRVEQARQADLERQQREREADVPFDAPMQAAAAKDESELPAPLAERLPAVSGRVVTAAAEIPAQQSTAQQPASTIARVAKPRPTEKEIVELIAAHYQVSNSRAVAWLNSSDFTQPELLAP